MSQTFEREIENIPGLTEGRVMVTEYFLVLLSPLQELALPLFPFLCPCASPSRGTCGREDHGD